MSSSNTQICQDPSRDVKYSIQNPHFPYNMIVDVNAFEFATILCRTISKKMLIHIIDSSKYSDEQINKFKQLFLNDIFFRDCYSNEQELARVLSRHDELEVMRDPEKYTQSSRNYIRLYVGCENTLHETQLIINRTILLENDVYVEFYVCTNCQIYWRFKTFEERIVNMTT